MRSPEFPVELSGKVDPLLYRRLEQLFRMLFELQQQSGPEAVSTKIQREVKQQLIGVMREPLLGQETVDPQLIAAATVPGTVTDITGTGGSNITVTVTSSGPGNSGKHIQIDISNDPTFNSVDVTTTYKVGSVSVVGAQGAAIADPTGGATIDVEARAQLSLLLAFFRSWGSIAP